MENLELQNIYTYVYDIHNIVNVIEIKSTRK